MTRRDLDKLRDTWLARAYQLQAESTGRQLGSRRLGAPARRAVQIQANTLTACANDLRDLLELKDAESHS